jgi:hypothetical protein
MYVFSIDIPFKGSLCKDMLGFLRIRIPRFEPVREVNKWLPIWADPEI